ncbi:hypothetical protein E2C01_047655 [Portunus trituberculatus]|uniref:Uncharacterized protein n=1 Tax=Portunus trituberculatus TaxID=210409 RepID=A0A5B7G8H0_PORTR|nr:hypothetical protein [Portunus trituberculatus]
MRVKIKRKDEKEEGAWRKKRERNGRSVKGDPGGVRDVTELDYGSVGDSSSCQTLYKAPLGHTKLDHDNIEHSDNVLLLGLKVRSAVTQQ